MDTSSSRLFVSLLGPPEISVDGAPIEVDTRKAIALIAFLAVTDTVHTRDALVELLWPESGPDRGRSALRRTLSTVKTSLGGKWLKADRFVVGLEGPGRELDLVTPFPDSIAHGHGADEACARCVGPLETFVSRFRGAFMEGFYLNDAPEFDAWQGVVAAEQTRRLDRALERLVIAHASQDEWTAAANVARRRVSLDPLDESANRQLMLSLAWAGDRSASIEAYRECVGILDRELGVPPLEETIELADAILAEDLPRMRGMARGPSPPRREPPSTRLVGRETELETLTRHEAGCVSIGGQVGIGKTALVEALTRMSRRPVLVARGLQSEGSVPYGIVGQLLRGRSLDGVGDWVRRELVRLVPEVGVALEPEEIEPLAAERRLHDAVVSFLAHVGRGGHLAIDDVQWVDPPSSAALAALAARAEELDVGLFLAGRWEEVRIESPLRSVAGERLELPPLEPDAAVRLARESGVDVVDVDDLMRRTGGVPLYLVTPVEGPDAERLRASIRERLDRLDELSRQVLTAVAIEDGPVGVDWLLAVSGRSDEELATAIDRLVSGNFLREHPDGVEFPHEIQREAVYHGTRLVRRRLLHRRAASAASGTDVKSLVAGARHARLAGDDEAAAEYLLQAGDLARPSFDLAAESYREALGLGHPDRKGIHRRLGEISMLRGDYQAALRDLEAAATSDGFDPLIEHLIGDVYRRLGRWEQAERQFELARKDHPRPALLLSDWALMADRLGDVERARTLAMEAVELATGDAEAARALGVLGLLTEDPVEAREHLELSLRRAGGDPVLRLAALHALSLAVESAGDLAGAVRLAQETLEVAVGVGDRHRQAAILSRLADLHRALGAHDQSREHLTESVRLFAEIGGDGDDLEPEIWMLTRW